MEMISTSHAQHKLTLDRLLGGVDHLQQRNEVGSSLAGAVLGARQNVAASERRRDGGFLCNGESKNG